ncbi:putative ribonuclease H-like domain-containing protein [Tanacetum coccineum]
MEAQYGKFLDMIYVVRINVPLIDVLAGMRNYGKFLKELVSNKHKLEQISSAFFIDECSAIIQNKVPPKFRDPGSFLILCDFSKTFSCNTLADLRASINLMSYSLLVEVGKFTFPVDFVILEIEEDSKVPLVLGRPFIHTADAEDANQKLLRSLPSTWNNIALIMRNKSDLDTMSMDDLYNNLKVYEAEIKGQSSSSSNSQNVAFVSLENTSSTNEAVNTAHDVTTASSQRQTSSLTYADDVIFFFFANQSNSPQLNNEDLEQIDIDDLEEMDLKWQVAMLTMRVKIFLKKTGTNLNFNGKETVGFDKTKVECYNCHRRSHFVRECRAPRN